ncbi:MAG TPA: HlyD family efflux transporter periplasmic adaptor subunit, partial [Vicinamibacterales bacterium]
NAITCLGRIAPEDEVVHVSARSLSGQPSIVGSLDVREGSQVRAGQVLATLNSEAQLKAAWHAADADASVADRRLAQVKAGAKQGDLLAQQSEIAGLEREVANAELSYHRVSTLGAAAAAAQAEVDASKLTLDTKRAQLQEAQARLKSLAEVRPVDVALAQAELNAARERAGAARAEFEQAIIKAPFAGRVVAVDAWPGEEVGSAGILELARVDRMYVVAEVAENDVARVRVGQRATVTGDELDSALTGVVERIGSKVAKKDVLNVDPTALSDARVVETWIRLDDPARAGRFINGEVSVRIAK